MKYFILLIVFVVASCTSHTIYKEPKDLIPKDTMVLLLQDLYVANSAKNYKNKNKQRNIEYVHLIYDTYKIDSTRFTSSNVYYTSKLNVYEEILKKVQSNLDTLLKEKRRKFNLPAKLQELEE